MKKYGATGFATIGSSVSVTAGTPAQLSASNTIKSLMAANEEDYSFITFKVAIASGASTNGNILTILVRRKDDGTNEAPAPASTYDEEVVCKKIVNGTNSTFYVDGENIDKEATFYLDSSDDSITVTVSAMMWDWDAPA